MTSGLLQVQLGRTGCVQNVNSLSRAAFCWSFQAVSGAKSRIICAALETLLLLATQGRERRGDREEREGEREFAQYERGREGERERERDYLYARAAQTRG